MILQNPVNPQNLQNLLTVHNIRQIGDPLLHTEVAAVNFSQPNLDLNANIKILQERLMTEAGVGIAANQCCAIASPSKIIIVGIYNNAVFDIVKQRYPNEKIPKARVMLNPKIISYLGEKYYPGEGCLSVEGGMRGKVGRYKSVNLEYYDEAGHRYQEILTGFEAHVAQHECDHLQGIVYLEHAFDELTRSDFIYIQDVIEQEFNRRKTLGIEPEVLQERHITFDRDSDQRIIVVKDQLLKSIHNMSSVTLSGIFKVLERYMRSG